MIEIKDYQEKAIRNLIESANKLLERDQRETLVFKAPTGSGKTLMVAEFIKRLADRREDRKEIAFIWTAPRQLHTQSKEKLDKYYSTSRAIECKYFEDLTDNRIAPEEVLFLNWESINKKDNVYIRENEQDRNLSKVMENTASEGTKIVLIIDESHFTAKTETSRALIGDIHPDLVVEVSATPHIHSFYNVLVEFEDVKTEGMIKKEISINPELDQHKISGKSSDEIVLENALRKRHELVQLLKKENSAVNPLLLIQLPDKKIGVLDRQDQIIKLLKDKFHITTDTGKLAIYLSEEKTNLENIEMLDNDTQVLIFKQAIALGWDCPRAYILVMFRDMQSMDFTIQTVGRIMRMPEFRHYDNEDLNKGYVFTNLADINITEEVAKGYITIYEARRRQDLYKPTNLPSIHIIRQREKTRLSGEFSKILIETTQKLGLHKNVNLHPKSLVTHIMVDGKITVLDKIQSVEHKGEVQFKISNVELQHRFDLFIRGNCSPFAPADSMGRIKTALYKFFEKVIKRDDSTFAQKIILSEENNGLFIDIISRSKEAYTQQVAESLEEQPQIDKYPWNVPQTISYTSKYQEIPKDKSIMKPYYTSNESNPEKEFIKLLESNKKVVWWFKNGTSDRKYFAVDYLDSNKYPRAFYVDFIFMLKDGRIGIFDTKEGRTAADAKEKAEALAKYVTDQKSKGKKLFGGICININGSWRYNDEQTYYYDEHDLRHWKTLSFE